MSTTELERRDPIAALSEKPLYDTIDGKQLAIVRTKMKGLNDVEVAMALELAAGLGLNVIADEMYAAKGNNGELLVMVGRNGLLRKAEEYPDYLGYEAGVVYENDEFSKGPGDPDSGSMAARAGVRHVQGHPKDRGACVGAWAVAQRRGRPPRYFFAPIEDYRPNNPHPKSSWARNPTVMIDKVPISVVHRTICNLSGVYLREEVDKMLERDGEQTVITAEEERAAMADLVGELEGDAGLHADLLDAIDRLNALSPGSWGLAKAQMTLPGRSAEELRAELRHIREEIAREEARRPQADADATVDEETITDAEVIPEVEYDELEGQIADLEAYVEEEEDGEKLSAAMEQLRELREKRDALS